MGNGNQDGGNLDYSAIADQVVSDEAQAGSHLEVATGAIGAFSEAVELIRAAVGEIDGRKETALGEIDTKLMEMLGLTVGEDGVKGLGIGGFWGSQLVAGLFAEGEESEGVGIGGLLGLLMGGMFAGDENQQDGNPFQAIMAQMITNMLTVGEGEESPLKPLYDALDIYVKGDEEGKGGLFQTLDTYVKGDKEGKGGLFALLRGYVDGGEGKEDGLKGKLTKHGEVIKDEITKHGGMIQDRIQTLWNWLFGFKPEQGDEK